MEKDFILVRSLGVIKQIEKTQILFIEAECGCSFFYLQTGEKFSCSKSLREIGDSLPPFFVRIRRNCLVNAHKISEFKVKQRKIALLNGTKQVVSHRNIKALTNTLMG